MRMSTLTQFCRCLGFLLVSFLAVPWAAAQPAHTHQAFRYPDETASFRIVTAWNYDDLRLGFQLRYVILESGGRTVDLFVYPRWVGPTESLADLVESSHEALKAGLREAEVTGDYRDLRLEVEEEAEVDIGEGQPPVAGIASRFVFRRNDLELVSRGFVTIRDEYQYKIRVSHDRDFAAASPGLLEDFIREVLVSTVPRDAVAEAGIALEVNAGAFDGRDCEIPGRLGAPLVYAGAAVASIKAGRYLRNHAAELDRQRALAAFWMTQQGERKSKDQGGEDCQEYPALDALAAVEREGLLAEYVWDYLGAPWWRQPEGLDLPRFRAWKAVHLQGHEPYRGQAIALKPTGQDEPPAGAGGSP